MDVLYVCFGLLHALKWLLLCLAVLLQFAYGACELLFNPFSAWLTKGPINKKFKLYMANKNIHWYQKSSMLAYLSSYLVSGKGPSWSADSCLVGCTLATSLG
jgi:hypothetical protein